MNAMRAVCMDCTPTRLCAKHRAEKDAQVQTDMAAAQEAIRRARELGFKWEEPPGKRRTSTLVDELAPILAVLRSRPGQWAVIRTYSKDTGARTGRRLILDHLPQNESWEVTQRTFGEGSRLYARYLGPDIKP